MCVCVCMFDDRSKGPRNKCNYGLIILKNDANTNG